MPARSRRRIAIREVRLAWESGALVVLVGVVAFTALAHVVVHLHARESWLLVGGASASALAIVCTFVLARRIVVAGRDATDRLQRILDHAPYAISVVRLSDGRYLRVNQAFCRETGMTQEEALQRTYHDILAPDRREAAEAAREAVLRRGEIRDVEITTVHEGGRKRHILLSAVRLDDEDEPAAVLITINVTASREAEEARRLLAARYRRLYESLQDGFARTDLAGNIVESNPAFQAMLGYTADELRLLNFRDLTLPSSIEREMAQLDQVRTRGFSDVYEKEYRRKDGSILPAQLRTYLETDEAGNEVGYWAIVTDITERKRAAEDLRRSERRLSLAIRATSDAIWEWNIQTDDGYNSPRWYAMLGYPDGEPGPGIHAWRALCHPDDRAQAEELAKARLESGDARGFEATYRLRAADGSWRWILARGNVVERTPDGRPLLLAGTSADVTERVEAERAVRASLAEKTILLQEVHHRVKNNLQIISSLLSLQADRSRNTAAAATLHEMRGRVHSMALLHEAIYRSPSLAEVDVPAYLESITSHLLRVHGSRTSGIRLDLDVHPLTLPIDPAVSCGLIVNELVSNALKHAFGNGRTGRVAVRLASHADRIALEVADDGSGLPADFDPKATTTLGMQIVGMLAEKLDGTLDVVRGDGTLFRVSFPTPRA